MIKRNRTSWCSYLASLLTAMLLSSASAQITKSHDASLASSSFYGTDDGMNLTIDAATGLTWLDWTATVNISAADMVNTHLQPGGFLHGWRLATPDELLVVLQNIAPGFDYSAWPGNKFGPVGPGLAWVDHFGLTHPTLGTYGRAYSYDADNDEWWHSYMGDYGGGSQLNGQNGAPTATPPGAFNTIGFALVAASSTPSSTLTFTWSGEVGTDPNAVGPVSGVTVGDNGWEYNGTPLAAGTEVSFTYTIDANTADTDASATVGLFTGGTFRVKIDSLGVDLVSSESFDLIYKDLAGSDEILVGPSSGSGFAVVGLWSNGTNPWTDVNQLTPLASYPPIEEVIGTSPDSIFTLPLAGGNTLETSPFTEILTNLTFTVSGGNATPPATDSVLEIGTVSTTVSGVATLPITLTGGGDEFALSGSVSFDATVFSNPQFTVGAGAPASASLTENLTDAANGNAGFLLGLSFGETFASGSSVVVDLQLTVNAQASKAEHAVTFGDSPSPRGVVNDLAEDLTVTWTDGSVTVINSDPVATDDQENTDEDTVLTVAAPGVLDNDSDPDVADVLTVVPVVSATTPQGASVSIDADGSISYDPTGSSTLNALPAGTDANDTIDYTVEDGDGGSDTGTLQVTVAGVNDAPTAVDDVNIASTDENVVLNITAAGVLANDTDPDTGDTLSIASVDATSASGAALTLNGDGSIRYDSTAAATVLALADGVDLVDSFTYTVEDALGLQDSATISVTVSGVEFEGDVTPRSNGDNVIDVTDAVMMRRFVVGLETLSAAEFSRVDTAPRSAGGDGKLTVGDFVQTLRYAVGLDAVQRISGPTEPSSPMVAAQVEARVEVDPGSAKISMAPIVGDDGNVALSISMDSLGQVSAVGFSVAFDPAIYRYDAYALAAAAQGKTAFINAKQATEGRLGIVIANNNVDQTFADGKIGLLNLNLTTISKDRLDESILEFGDYPASRSVSDTSAKKIPTEYVVSTLGAVVPEVAAMPQTWLSSYFALSDLNDTDKEATVWGADADPDGDGQPNHVEYAAGTSPTDRHSAFVSHIDMSGDAIKVSFYPYHEDRRYQLLRSDLEDGSEWTEIRSENWQPSTDASLGEGRSTTIKTDGALGFYRVQVSLPNS